MEVCSGDTLMGRSEADSVLYVYVEWDGGP